MLLKNKIVKKFFSLVLVCLIFVPFFAFSGEAKVGDEVKAAKKIISVVYDDSGSMFGNSWVYANYAMQSLAALLNEKDELYITYMSSPETVVETDLSDVGKVVSNIREWSESGTTPGKTIKTAAKKLQSISEKDASTQFWLVVMTDGKISGLSKSLQKTLNSYKGKTMSNSSALNVVYLGMGSKAEKISEDKAGGLYSYRSKTDQEIFSAMFEVANLISGRFSATGIKQIDSKTIQFSSPLPLYSISVLSQSSDAIVEKAYTTEAQLDINRNILLDATDIAKSSQLRLFGNASVINKMDSSGSAQVVPAETYTLKFSKKVDVDDLLIQYEPAIGINVSISSNGIEIEDLSKIIIGDSVEVAVTPVVPGTKTALSSGDLPEGLSWKIEYIVNQKEQASTDSTKLAVSEIKEGENIIRASMLIPGYAPIVFEEDFDLEKIVYNFSIETVQPDPLKYYRKNLNKGSEQGQNLGFYVANDGVRLTKNQLSALGVTLDLNGVSCDNSMISGFLKRMGTLQPECVLELADDGKFEIVPKKKLAFTSFLLRAGKYTVDVSLSSDNSINAQGFFEIVAKNSDILDLLWLILSILAILYVLRIITKPKFHGEAINYELYKINSEGHGVPQRLFDCKTLNITKGLFRLSKSKMKFYGYEIVAGPGKTIFVSERSIAKNCYSYGTSAANPANRLASIARGLFKTEQPDGSKTAQDISLGEGQKLYLRASKGDPYITCIWVE